jgi:hypothetical protein
LTRDLSIVSIQDGVLLGLRLLYDTRLLVTGIVGSEALQRQQTYLVQGPGEEDILVRLCDRAAISSEAIAIERSIHMLQPEEWHSEQTGDILLHQKRPDLRYNMVSPLAALAALQRNVGSGITYLSKQREILLREDSIELSPALSPDHTGYVCGPEASRRTAHQQLLGFERMAIDIHPSIRKELMGLGHLFALTVGAAMHLVTTAAPHTPIHS